MNYRAIALAGAFTAFISSAMLPVVQLWVPFTIIAMLAVYAAQKVAA